MPINEVAEPHDLHREWLQIAALSIAGALVVWLSIGDGMAAIRTELSRPKVGTTVVARRAPVVRPCSPAQLELDLFFNGCADSTARGSCDRTTAGVFRGVAHLRDSHHAYLLHVGVEGGYHGPDTYPLVATPAATSVPSGATVALSDVGSGALWRSTAGWLRIDPGGNSGAVRAGLVYDGAESVVLGLKTIGAWHCG
jgi:hypothetical protein